MRSGVPECQDAYLDSTAGEGIVIPGLGNHVPIQKALHPDGLEGSQEITANGDIPEHLSAFHHNTFFTRLFIIENMYKTPF